MQNAQTGSSRCGLALVDSLNAGHILDFFLRLCEIRALNQVTQIPKARKPQPTIK